ncbi:putative pyridine nucleotide-disulfide oxidoreductase [Burkholderia pseudomallei MSHR456]|nr:putative pyridine nucleotide-disulfide oxidoreductase [Burkholderia pseudomallei MSHR456]
MPTKPRVSRAACASFDGVAASDSAKRASAPGGACSTSATTRAPAARAVASEAIRSGPLPAITTRSPRTGAPPLTSACKPPAPVTPGSVQPANGSSSSRAPQHRISFR